MTLWEIVLTLALSWGFVLWGVLLCHGLHSIKAESHTSRTFKGSSAR